MVMCVCLYVCLSVCPSLVYILIIRYYISIINRQFPTELRLNYWNCLKAIYILMAHQCACDYYDETKQTIDASCTFGQMFQIKREELSSNPRMCIYWIVRRSKQALSLTYQTLRNEMFRLVERIPILYLVDSYHGLDIWWLTRFSIVASCLSARSLKTYIAMV
jgi:hypothetical protein